MHSDTAKPDGNAPLDPRRWLAFGVVLAAGFMDLLDVTIVNVAVPSIQQDLAAGYAQLQWIVAAYVLAFAATLITGGRLGDAFGRRRVFLVGMTAFTVASALCGSSTDPAMLIAGRFVQGAAAGLMVPQILAIIQVTFPAGERSRAIAIYSGVGGSASAIGLSLGGLLVQWDLFGLGWRPIFLVNVPVGVAALIAAVFVVRDSRASNPPRLDPVGMVLATSAVLLLVYPLTEGRRLGWPAWTYVMMAAAAAVFAVFVGYERRRSARGRSPLVELGLFRSRPFAVGLSVWLLFWIALGGFFFVWTLFMQAGLGWSAMRAGLTAVAFAVGAGIGATTAMEALVPRFGRRVLVAGGLVNAAGFGLYAAMAWHYGADFGSWTMAIALVLSGVGFGMVVAPALDLLLSQVPQNGAGSASGLLNTGQQLGMALGIALVGVLFFQQLDHDSGRGVDAVSPVVSTQLADAGLSATAQNGVLAGFRACVQDRSAAIDPAAVPQSCRSVPAGGPVADILGAAGARANAENFSRTFGYTLWFGAALLVLVCLGFLAVPKSARIPSAAPAPVPEPV
ncbi:MAG: MFS transporter [Mycobacteriaceae bacterium]|nr:MFS transporter [Mycobacteriaceae bacterium]